MDLGGRCESHIESTRAQRRNVHVVSRLTRPTHRQVGFSGDLCRDLCAAYTADASDLITAEYSPVFAPLPTRSRKLVSRWCWQQTASDAFLALVGHKGPEHVQRFSRRYLDRLHELASGREPG